jgi:hypothetical protein
VVCVDFVGVIWADLFADRVCYGISDDRAEVESGIGFDHYGQCITDAGNLEGICISGAVGAPSDGANAAFDAAILDGFELGAFPAVSPATLDSGIFQDARVFDRGGVSGNCLYVELSAESIDLDGGVCALGDRGGLVVVGGWFGAVWVG